MMFRELVSVMLLVAGTGAVAAQEAQTGFGAPRGLGSSKAPASATATPKPDYIAGLGMKLVPISPDLKDKYQLNADQTGVMVIDVSPSSPAAERGLQPGDVVVGVQQYEVKSVDDIRTRIEAAQRENRKAVVMLISRGAELKYVPLSLSPRSNETR